MVSDYWFSRAAYNWLLHSPREISRNVDVSAEHKKDVDCDFIVHGTDVRPAVVLLLKTSMRERWKQWDRDAILSSGPYREHALFASGHMRKDPYFIALFFHEKPKGSETIRKGNKQGQIKWRHCQEFAHEAIALATKRREQVYCRNLRVSTVLNYSDMADLAHFIKDGTSAAWLW